MLEIFDALVDEYILDGDDEEYIDARNVLKDKRGLVICISALLENHPSHLAIKLSAP